MKTGNLILIFGDQLSPKISSLKYADRTSDRILMAEVADEASYVRHHKKKIVFIFSAMRHFAEHLRRDGWSVDYVKLDDQDNSQSFTGELNRAVERLQPVKTVLTEPSEWRVRSSIEGWAERAEVTVKILDDDRFICSREDFCAWARGRKQLRMEYFYREMRRKTGLLMDGVDPAGGKWNFDNENRKPASADLVIPQPRRFESDAITHDVSALVAAQFNEHFGDLEPFWFAATTKDAETALDHFIEEALPLFGDYQDAMVLEEPFLYHSVLALYMNVGLLDPLAVCQRVEAEYRSGRVPINAAEGFIRQVIGWREFVRGIYWLKMPAYADQNFFAASRPLPEFYWSGDTDMMCLRAAITQTRQEAYAHHIQRLMVTGNFAMLAGVKPREVHEWYLAVYADAFEWVELPNTLGMSQFADGGLLASKPYAASGNYMNKMSNYCRNCRYNVKQKTGSDACPFNSLYWDFLARNRVKLNKNPRLAQVYRTWDRMSDEKRRDYRRSAAQFLKTLA
jgi:deoxyribodipyrimidine photolyase-related protein